MELMVDVAAELSGGITAQQMLDMVHVCLTQSLDSAFGLRTVNTMYELRATHQV